jgi:DNA sulfur modification protein DndB
LLQDLVEYERTTLAPRSRKLFTFSAIHTANSSLLIGSAEQQIEIATVFWNAVIEAFPEWSEVHNKRLSASEVRQDFVHSHGTVLHAIGKVGNAMIREKRNDWTQLTAVLASLNWLRTNATDWEGRVLIGGRVSKSNQSVLLTSALIKEKLNLGLTNEETRLTNSHKGQNT